MECRRLEIEQMWAKDLQNMRTIFSKMCVYAEVSISSDPRSIDKTPVDRRGEENPEWKNYRMNFTIEESLARSNQITLVFQLLSRRVFGDKTVGFVYVPVIDLFREDGVLAAPRRQQIFHGENCGSDGGYVDHGTRRSSSACYQVTTPSGKAKGMLGFSYRLGETFMHPAELTLLHPAPYQPYGHWYGFSHPQVYHHHPGHPPQAQGHHTHALPYGQGGKWNHNWWQHTSNNGNTMSKFGLGALLGMAAGCLEALFLCAVCGRGD